MGPDFLMIQFFGLRIMIMGFGRRRTDPRHDILCMEVELFQERGGSGKSDSMLSGTLASPTPPNGGRREERGHEENETESRGDV